MVEEVSEYLWPDQLLYVRVVRMAGLFDAATYLFHRNKSTMFNTFHC